MSTVQMFSYNGFIGDTSDIENGNFINDIKTPGQLGIVVKVEDVEITSEARDLLKKAQREGGTFAPIMMTKSSHQAAEKFGKYTIGLCGFNKHAYNLEDPILSRTCDIEGFNEIPVNDDLEIPEDFKQFVDSQHGTDD